MSVKTLVMPEWWLLAPAAAAFLLLAIEMLFRMRRLYLGERAPRDDACRGLKASHVLGGGGVAHAGRIDVLLFLGLPVAFSFIVINLVGAVLFLGGEAGLVQLARNSVGSVGELLADADSAFHPDGRGALPHRARGQGDRRRRSA